MDPGPAGASQKSETVELRLRVVTDQCVTRSAAADFVLLSGLFSDARAVRAATLHHPWFRCGPAATSCSGVRRMRLTLPSPGDGESEARLRPRRFTIHGFAAAQTAHPCAVVRSVRRDFVSRRKDIRPYPPGSRTKRPSIRCYRIAALSCSARGPAQTSMFGRSPQCGSPCRKLCSNAATSQTPTLETRACL
jgi:hypothetical protein